jgi:Chaperone of endosialidase
MLNLKQYTMKTKKLLLLFIAILFMSVLNLNAQVAVTDVDGYTPNNSAVLDIHSTTKGLLVPRLSTSQVSSISAPIDGLLVYNTDSKEFYFYSATKGGWNAIGSGGGESLWSSGTSGVYLQDFNQKVGIGTDSPISKLEVIGDASFGIDDPLFEVKNTSGQTVFAVHQEGVRVYVSDGNVKGTKGGFAISGISASKDGLEYLRVSPDSTRIYVKESTSKATKGGFAISGISAGKLGSESFLQVTPENYFIGHLAGYSISTGLYNSFMGYQSGYSTTEGNYNVFLGRGTGYTNTSGSENIFIGDLTGYSNDIGYANVFVGDASGYTNSSGYWNIFLGRSSGYSNTTGAANVILGDFAGFANTTGYDNVFMGDYAGGYNTTGYNNVFIGKDAGNYNTTGYNNVFMGAWSGSFNETGNYNVFLGDESGYYNDVGWANVYVGQKAGYESDSSKWNVALGTLAGYSNVGGQQNSFIGQEAGYSNSTGSYNTFLGTVAGYDNTTGSYNVFVGQGTGANVTTSNYNTYLGAYAGGMNITGTNNVCLGYAAGYNETGSNKLYIEGIYSGVVDDYTTALIYGDFSTDYLRLNANVEVYGTLTNPSDRRWKKNIYTIDNSLEKVTKLRGVTYEWKTKEFSNMNFSDGKQIGVIAQEVEEIVPEVVQTNEDGFKTVDYAKLTPLLIEAIKAQQSQITNLTNEIAKVQKQNDNLRRGFDTLKTQVEKMKGANSNSVSLSGPSN